MPLKIVDCTLRDGSHAINYKFGEELTKNILMGLEKAGIEWIEMGHGKGIGASKKCGKPALLSDEEYIELAKSYLKKAKYGFFFGTFGEKKDIQLVAKKGMNFLRFGVNINKSEVNKVEKNIKYAKEQGLIVHIALMKSYAVSSESEYIEILQKLSDWGVDLITLMDSAGTMLPGDVKKFITIGRMNTDTPIGFHAHNNLQLAISNSITAIESGAKSVDACIGGLGRSSGNAPIEILAILLDKYGWYKSLDYKILSGINDKYIFPLIKEKNRFSSKELTFGYAGFHSNFFPLILRKLEKHPQLDYREIIFAISKKEKIYVTDKLVEEVINKMLKNKKHY